MRMQLNQINLITRYFCPRWMKFFVLYPGYEGLFSYMGTKA